MRRIIVAAAIAIIAASCLTQAAHAEAPEANGRIAFSRALPEGGSLVLTARPDGTDVREVPLPYLNEDFGRGVWSPDGTRLLISNLLRFTDAGDLLPFRPATVMPDGSDFTLLDPPGAPGDMYCTAWSPDGARIVCGFGGDDPGLFSIRASDGGDPIRMTSNPYGAGDQPGDYSPDGTKIVFVRFKPGSAPGRAEFIDEKAALFVVNVDGTGEQQITPYGLAAAHEIASAAWSPNGSVIASSTRDGRLFTVRPDGHGLSPVHLQVGTGDYSAYSPAFSPDGGRIVFALRLGGSADIYSATSDGADVRRITSDPAPERFPDWGR
jgi:WD40 repeat protein